MNQTSCFEGSFGDTKGIMLNSELCSNIYKNVCSEREMENSNCSGTRGKEKLNLRKQNLIEKLCFNFYDISPAHRDFTWNRVCIKATDEMFVAIMLILWMLL